MKTIRMSARVTITGLLLALHPLVPAHSQSIKCDGRVATLVGTGRSEELRGTAGADVIVGRGGDDVILSRRGRDVVCAGDGFDNVAGGRGRDLLQGGAGDDSLQGGRRRDRLEGGRGVDALFGGAADDRLLGGSNDAPFPTEGLIGGPGDDRLDGGGGLDSALFFGATRGVDVDLTADIANGEGSDQIVDVEGVVCSNSDDVIVGDDGSNGLFGQEGDDHISGLGSGTLASGDWDLLSGDEGADDVNGGNGFDIVTYNRIPLQVSVDLAAGTAGDQGADRLVAVEGVWGSRLDDVLLGDANDNAFLGSFGNDDISGGTGTDTAIFRSDPGPIVADLSSGSASGVGLDVLTGIENIWGSSADDLLIGDDDANEFLGFGGDDSLWGAAGDDILEGGVGFDRMSGGAGLDTCRSFELALGCELEEAATRGSAPRGAPQQGWGGGVRPSN